MSFDIERIVGDDLQELDVRSVPAAPDAHYTEIVLEEVFRPLKGRTIGKIKDHLASIYRIFLRRDDLELKFDLETLSFEDTAVLVAPYFKDPQGDPRRWYKEIDLDFGMDQRVHGFAALRETGSTSEAGFALFRRDRLIQGSRDEAYRPPFIFGHSNSFAFQRLFGELHLEGFEVSHTKDGFQWDEHEEIVLESLKEALADEPTPLLSQAEGHRSRIRAEDLRSGAEEATERTADAITQHISQVIQDQLNDSPESAETPSSLPVMPLASHRTITVELENEHWIVDLELAADPGVGDWVFLSESPRPSVAVGEPRRVGIRVSLAHPFMERFAGPDATQIEPLLRLAVALVLAEITAREAGLGLAGTIRRRVNQLLREALAKP